jgi:hypothetical protein
LALRAAFVASSKAQRTLAKTIAARVQFEYTTNPRSAGVSIWKKHHPGILMDIQEAGDFLVHELARLDVSARVIPKFDPRGTGLIELVFTLDQ